MVDSVIVKVSVGQGSTRVIVITFVAVFVVCSTMVPVMVRE